MKQPNVADGVHVAGLDDIRVRPYGVLDGERLRRMSRDLSRHSLYSRFFSGTPSLPEAYLTALNAIDHWNHEALVALLDGEIIGVAEYVRDRAEPRRAELAVLVTDPWQRRGLARRMVVNLAELAERRGIREFDAEVILGNREAMLALGSGWPAVRARSEDGAARYSLPLPIPFPARAPVEPAALAVRRLARARPGEGANPGC
ncbi:N-acetyltransferase family protein [Spirillospora sp. CA-294931]|uniref:GNAT family N-acetyltransferase n=1 Tax=Spirillospora sp. CA-294931 TaxID=3240042 RepID=UPI003D8B7011